MDLIAEAAACRVCSQPISRTHTGRLGGPDEYACPKGHRFSPFIHSGQDQIHQEAASIVRAAQDQEEEEELEELVVEHPKAAGILLAHRAFIDTATRQIIEIPEEYRRQIRSLLSPKG